MTKTKKRLYLSELEQIDNKHNDSFVRAIEMIVDSITNFDGYSIQFWTDVRTYGLYEAILYLTNSYKPDTKLENIYEQVLNLRD